MHETVRKDVQEALKQLQQYGKVYYARCECDGLNWHGQYKVCASLQAFFQERKLAWLRWGKWTSFTFLTAAEHEEAMARTGGYYNGSKMSSRSTITTNHNVRSGLSQLISQKLKRD